MYGLKWFALAAAVMLVVPCGSPAMAAEQDVKLPPKEKFHLYLLAGQSNMAGRGKMTDADRQPVPRVLMLTKENRWVPAAHPLHFDKPTIAGVGLGIDFAKVMARQDPSITIGLIPSAFGGSPLSRWSSGGDLQAAAIARTKLAMAHGTLRGVLWHQGESDTATAELANSYGERLAKMIQDLRGRLKSPKLPLVAGQLGEFYLDHKRSKSADRVNAALIDLPKNVAHTACVGSEGLGHKGDRVHFSAKALRRLGRRYAEAMLSLSK